MIRVNEGLGPEVRFRKPREHHQSNDQRYSHVDQWSGNRDANIALPGNLARGGRGDLAGIVDESDTADGKQDDSFGLQSLAPGGYRMAPVAAGDRAADDSDQRP